MSAKIKLTTALPADEIMNGLDHLAEDLTEGDRFAAFVVFHVKSTEVFEGGVHVPKLRVHRVEPLGDAAQLPTEVAKFVLSKQEERTGAEPLPLDAVVAPTKHPDVCDHNWVIETDSIADVPIGQERKTCLRCGHVKYFPMAEEDPLTAEAEAVAAEAEAARWGHDNVVAIVPADADATIRDPFQKSRR